MQAGVRYQRQFWQTRAYRLPSLGTYDIPADRNNIAPRVGVNWDPTGTGALSIHSAYGVYHDSIIGAAVGVPDIVNGSTGVRTLVMRFPQSLTAWNAPGRRLPESAVGAYPSLFQALDPGLESSYSHQFSAGIDRDIGGVHDGVGQSRCRPRTAAARDDRLQPGRARARTGTASGRRRWPGRYVRIDPAVHLVWLGDVPRSEPFGEETALPWRAASRELRPLEDGGQHHRLPGSVHFTE